MKSIERMKSKAVSGMMLSLLIMSILMLTVNVQPAKTSGMFYTGADGWLYRKAHNIAGSSEGDQTYYQMKIIVHYGNGTDNGENVYLNGHSQPDFDDIRFTWYNSSGGSEVECNYWIEKKYEGENATFWVEVDYIPMFPENATIYIYYGNDDVLTTSNGVNVFLFWDDFETNLSKWSIWYNPAEISTDHPYEGDRGLKTQKKSSHIDVELNTTTNTAVRVWFYDQMSSNWEKFVMIGSYPRNYAEMGVDEDQSTTHYIYRIGYTSYYVSSVSRSVGWHLFEITHDDTTKRFWIDGKLQIHTDNNDIAKFGMGSFWEANSEYGYFDVAIQRKYCDPEPVHGAWASEEILVPYVFIDGTLVSDERADVGSVQTIGFHAKWDNGSSVVEGEVYVNGTKYITNSSGWIFFNDVSSVVDRKTWIVTGVNCSGVTMYMQTAPNPSIIWDQIKIIDGGVTKESVMVGETATIWFQATYEYDDTTFDDTKGILYVNGSEMSWSTANRWEYNYIAAVYGSKALIITGVFDSLYGLTVINDAIGAQTVIVLGEPTLTVSLDSSTTYIGYKVKISGNLTHPNGTGISGANLLLAYSVTSGESWNDITSVTTTAGGEYFVEWMPTATGNYLVRVSWEGNETLYVAGTEAYSTLAVTPVEGKYVFSVISNSTVSELAFNSTSRVLSFTVSGPSGTIGYTKVTIAKTLIGDISKLKVYLDGNQINYTVTSTETSFLLYFTYQHSTHEVVVSLGPPPFIPPQLITPLSLSILAVALAVAAAIFIFKIRKGKPTTILDSVLK